MLTDNDILWLTYAGYWDKEFCQEEIITIRNLLVNEAIGPNPTCISEQVKILINRVRNQHNLLLDYKRRIDELEFELNKARQGYL